MPPKVSFVMPAFDEAENLPSILERVLAAEDVGEIEVIVVDDHSGDSTPSVVRAWAARDPRVRGVRLARNSGSHMAILCGLQFAAGDAVIVLAADGQDPPEFAKWLLEAWNQGAHVVWAVRTARRGETLPTRLFSRLYYLTMNRWTSVRLPPAGADFVLLDRRVVDVLVQMPERNTSLLALITWLGFRQVELPYVKEARHLGRSKWTVRRKARLAMDSLFAFSALPLRFASGVGACYAVAGFGYAALLLVNKLTGGLLFGPVPVQGWAALMVVLLVSSGTLLLVLGVFGEYLWRTLEEVRARPRFAIEECVNLRQPSVRESS